MTAITADYLRQRLNYDPETGDFVWRSRDGVADATRWNKRYVGKAAGSIDSRGHSQIWVDGRIYSAHRLAWLYVYGEWPCGDIDHADRNKTNNAIGNLRLATRSQNNANATIRQDNTSGVKGVSWHSGHRKWAAYVGSKHLGYFTSLSDAARARRGAAQDVFGEFACHH